MKLFVCSSRLRCDNTTIHTMRCKAISEAQLNISNLNPDLNSLIDRDNGASKDSAQTKPQQGISSCISLNIFRVKMFFQVKKKKSKRETVGEKKIKSNETETKYFFFVATRRHFTRAFI